MKTFSHKRPVRDKAGNIVSDKPAPVSRVTVEPLGGQFGSDKRRRLVVTLKAGDVVEFRPERTRQAVTMAAVDLYRHALRLRAATVHLEKARNRKAAKQAKRAAARIQRADRKLTAELRAEREG